MYLQPCHIELSDKQRCYIPARDFFISLPYNCDPIVGSPIERVACHNISTEVLLLYTKPVLSKMLSSSTDSLLSLHIHAVHL